jgi:hypothetical protein
MCYWPDQRRVNKVTKLRVSQNTKTLLTNSASISFPRRALAEHEKTDLYSWTSNVLDIDNVSAPYIHTTTATVFITYYMSLVRE